MAYCWHCKAEFPQAHYDRVVYNKLNLHAEWDGWRMSGRFLIAPGKAGRITPGRVLGMLWEERARSRRSTEKNRTIVPRSTGIVLPVDFLDPARLPAREQFEGYA